MEKGEILGILGINGAGKSTLIKTIATVIDMEKENVILMNTLQKIKENIESSSQWHYKIVA